MTRRRRRGRGLGLPPAEHAALLRGYLEETPAFLGDAREALDAGRCGDAHHELRMARGFVGAAKGHAESYDVQDPEASELDKLDRRVREQEDRFAKACVRK